LALVAAFAPGTTTISGISDLRTKESDRVAAIERLLGAVGIRVQSERHDLRIEGGNPGAARGPIDTRGDHRIVMAAAVLGCAAGPVEIAADSSADVSFPGFAEALAGLQA
ncbi:MAG: hypothetical protein WA814_04065, partial [Candidatus Baltobacteraceae bacterium]